MATILGTDISLNFDGDLDISPNGDLSTVIDLENLLQAVRLRFSTERGDLLTDVDYGLVMEEINQFKQKTDWKPFIFGSLAGIGPWIVIILYAFGNADPSEVPWFVYAIVGSYFVFFNLFPINMILQYKKVGKWANYLYGEKTYIILSLVAKSVLAWLVFSGVMQPM